MTNRQITNLLRLVLTDDRHASIGLSYISSTNQNVETSMKQIQFARCSSEKRTILKTIQNPGS